MSEFFEVASRVWDQVDAPAEFVVFLMTLFLLLRAYPVLWKALEEFRRLEKWRWERERLLLPVGDASRRSGFEDFAVAGIASESPEHLERTPDHHLSIRISSTKPILAGQIARFLDALDGYFEEVVGAGQRLVFLEARQGSVIIFLACTTVAAVAPDPLSAMKAFTDCTKFFEALKGLKLFNSNPPSARTERAAKVGNAVRDLVAEGWTDIEMRRPPTVEEPGAYFRYHEDTFPEPLNITPTDGTPGEDRPSDILPPNGIEPVRRRRRISSKPKAPDDGTTPS